MKRFFTILFGLIVISAFAGTLYYLYSKSEETPITYGTEQPFVTTIIQKTVATGSVVPRKEVEIKPQVSGIVETLYIEPGDKVESGDLIAKIRIIPEMVSLNNAENRVNLARINLDNARRELERNRKSFDEGVISDSIYQQFVLDYEQATQELAASQDNLELIRKGSTARTGDASNTMVRATIEGMVLEVPLEEGDSVIETNNFNDGTTITTVADMDQLIFKGKVDESEVGKIRPGMDLLLTIGAIEDQTFEAVLEHIAPKGVEENGAIQFEIRAALKLKDDVFVRANYSANADIVLARADEVLAIKEALLVLEDGKAFVDVETAPQQFDRREIETGLSDGIQIEVVAGLTEEDRIKNPNAVD
jgi:HlyD family secretion protein